VRRALLAVLLLTGCAATKSRNGYLRTLDEHTEDVRLHRGFATALLMRGTLLTPAMREALADERSRLMGPAGDDGAFLARMDDEARDYWDVVFTAESPLEFDSPRFGDDDGGWRLRLVADGEEQPLVTVYRVRDPSPLQEMLYAHKNAWNELYVARFERCTPGPSSLVLEVGSGFGHAALRWTGDELR
jgi:hypothetical protein